MATERYKHIFLPGPSSGRGFTNPRRGRSKHKIPQRSDRIQHSEYLLQRLQETWQQAKDRQAVVHSDRQGSYIVFEGEPGFDLAVQSLEFLRSGIRLHNVRKEGDDNTARTLATVYVPHNKRGHFLRRIQAYATENLKDKDIPKNAKLVNSISDIKLAVLESFWRQKERQYIPNEGEVLKYL